MPLRYDGILVFTGHHGIEGICHARVYDTPRQSPIVIVGALQDNPGAACTVVVEYVAVSVEQQLIGPGKAFRLITHQHSPTPRFCLVEFGVRPRRWRRPRPATAGERLVVADAAGNAETIREPHPEASPFKNPKWTAIADIDALVGEHVRRWPKDQYTAASLFGRDGGRLVEAVAARVRKAGVEFQARVEEWTA